MATTLDTTAIRQAVRDKYKSVADSPEGSFAYQTGKAGIRQLGYDAHTFRSLPDSVVRSFCGIGNPFRFEPPQPGQSVVDVGCGAGVDSFIAAQYVGDEGRIRGIDLSKQMIEQALEHRRSLQAFNVSFLQGLAEAHPFAPETFDVAISNGSINLSPDKGQLFRELYRVLKPGARLQFADVILEEGASVDRPSSPKDWAG